MPFIPIPSSDSEQDPDLMAAVGQLSERLSKQKEELDQLRAEQQNMFRSLQQKLDAMTAAIVGAQRTSLAEHTREYRILLRNWKWWSRSSYMELVDSFTVVKCLLDNIII